jgi:hypothetical protein
MGPISHFHILHFYAGVLEKISISFLFCKDLATIDILLGVTHQMVGNE